MKVEWDTEEDTEGLPGHKGLDRSTGNGFEISMLLMVKLTEKIQVIFSQEKK